MKYQYTKFTCDKCKNTINKETSQGFPYDEGWCYIYKFFGKKKDQHTDKVPRSDINWEYKRGGN